MKRPHNYKQTTIILTGGGTGGSVAPLLALVDDFRQAGYQPMWIGTHTGIEKQMASELAVPYHGISAGKLRRYVSGHNLTDPFRVLWGFFQSLGLVLRLKPRLVITAGGFVSVPVVWAAWLLHIPIIVHQQDVRPGLANRLMAPLATVITVTFAKSLQDYGKRAVWTGNPVRKEFRERVASTTNQEKKILILGGGTGSEALNQIVKQSVDELTKLAVVTHITGAGKKTNQISTDRYRVFSFLPAEELARSMTEADVVIARAGLGTLTELSALGKATILIPMPHSHQVINARFVGDQGAALVLDQTNLDPAGLVSAIAEVLADSEKYKALIDGMSKLMQPKANENFYKVIKKILKDKA